MNIATLVDLVGLLALLLYLADVPAPSAVAAPANDPKSKPEWVEPRPDIPYREKPPHRPSDWLVEHEPVVPNASKEARSLLNMLYDITGRFTLTGQHNYAAEQRFSTDLATTMSGKTPAIYATDLGFAAAGDKDSAYVRTETVAELTRQWQNGSIISICWHAVPPTMDEPVTFRGEVQSRITDEQFDELLTPGTAINARWCGQVDAIAAHLKALESAHVPVLFRPYHEINGDWFWWTGHRGDAAHGSKQLFRQIYDRLTHVHALTNLIWVWNVDQASRADRQFVDYFPGLEYVDILSLDCYGAFRQAYYHDLNALSGGKVMGIAETSLPPSIDVYTTQPKWSYWSRWAIDPNFAELMAKDESENPPPALTSAAGQGIEPKHAGRRFVNSQELRAIVAEPRVLSLHDPQYLRLIDSIR